MSDQVYENLELELDNQESSGWKWLLTMGGAIVYAGAVIYAEMRAWAMITATLDPAYHALAAVGIFALGITALIMPIFIHKVVEPGAQRTFAMLFYMADFAAMAANAILDNARAGGTVNNEFLNMWGIYILPAMPVAVALGWSIVWLLDPSHKERDARKRMRAAIRSTMYKQMIAAANSQQVQNQIALQAERGAHDFVGRTIGVQIAPQRKLAEPTQSFASDGQTTTEPKIEPADKPRSTRKKD